MIRWLDGQTVRWLDGYNNQMVRWLDGQIVGWLDVQNGQMVKWLDGQMVRWFRCLDMARQLDYMSICLFVYFLVCLFYGLSIPTPPKLLTLILID